MLLNLELPNSPSKSNRFWIQDRLRVTNVMDFSAPQENEKPVEDQVMEFALKKMESYGFHKSRCSDALIKANHDVGKAFEDLMTELFELVYDVPQGKHSGLFCNILSKN